MLKQYLELYTKYSALYGPNTAIFHQGGKFYEIRDSIDPETGQGQTSARRAMEIMNIQITEQPGKGINGQMGIFGGIPVSHLHKWAKPLTELGWHSIIVDQVKDDYGEVESRKTVRILGPGTHVEIAEQDRLTMASLLVDAESKTFAASIADLTTGEVFSYETRAADAILHFFQVYCVKEVVVSCLGAAGPDDSYLKSNFGSNIFFHRRPWPADSNFQQSVAREEFFRSLFRVKSLLPTRAFLGFTKEQPLLEKALCLLLLMLQDHFPKHVEALLSHEIFQPEKSMRLGNNILEQLNILTSNGQKSILSLIDRTASALGKRSLRERILRPSTDPDLLEKRWDQISWAQESPACRLIQRELKRLYDLPRLHHKVSEGSITAHDVIQMDQTYQASLQLLKFTENSPLAPSTDLLESIQDYITLFHKFIDIDKARLRIEEVAVGFLSPMCGPKTMALEEEITQVGTVWSTAWKEFCSLFRVPPDAFSLVKKTESWAWEGSKTNYKNIQEGLAAHEKKESTSKPKNPLTSIQLHKKQSGPMSISCKEFYEYESKIRSLEGRLDACLRHELLEVCDSLWDSLGSFQMEWQRWLGEVDCAVTLGLVANDYKWIRPKLGDALDIKGLRHPLLELQATKAEYVRHAVALGSPPAPLAGTEGCARGWLLYGVNASGKSSLMKAVGISVLLAQAGCFVPAESMVLRPYDAAFSRIWSQDNVWAGLSSFAVEVQELREILGQATEKSLVLGDEVCSGTESISATSLVASVLEHLDDLGAHFLFATHLHDLTKIPGLLPRPGIQVWHLKVDRKPDGGLVYDRTLHPGPGSATYGLEVAKAMGLPFTLMARAYEIRRVLEGAVSAEEAPKSAWNAAAQRQACEHCHKTFVRDLEVHHAQPRSEGGGNELRNLVVLCEECHDAHHAGTLQIGPARQTSEGVVREFSLAAAPVAAHVPVAAGGGAQTSEDEDTQEEIKMIKITLDKFKGRPDGRALAALSQQGIHLTVQQLKKFKARL